MVQAAEDTYENWRKSVKASKGVSPLERPPPPLAEALHGSFIAKERMRGFDNGTTSLGSASTLIEVNTNDSLMNGLKFRATRSRKKVDFSIKMYADQVEQWYKESDDQSSQEEGTPLLTTSKWRSNSKKTQSEGCN